MKERPLYKYFVFSDVHGEYDALIQALNEAGYDRHNSTHKLISLGDAFDRGPRSRDVYEFLRNREAICVKGNHDTMFEEYLEHGMKGAHVFFNILHNGLGATIQSFTGLKESRFTVRDLDVMKRNISGSVLKWIKNLPLYYETSNFIFCHAGIDPFKSDWRQTDKGFMLWDVEYSHFPCPHTDKRVVIGHHHASKVRQKALADGYKDYPPFHHNYRPADHDNPIAFAIYGNTDENRVYFNDNKIAVDGMTNLTGKVNVLVLEDYPVEGRYIQEKEDEVIINAQNNDYVVANQPGVFSWAPNESQIYTYNLNQWTTTL